MADYSWPKGAKQRFRDFFRAGGGAPVIGTAEWSATRDLPEHVRIGQEEQPTQKIDMVNPRLMNTGWINPKALGHMCLPPDTYEDGWGPGSIYVCPECGCPWQAAGVRNISETYRWWGFGAKMRLGPKQYLFCGDQTQYYGNEGAAMSVRMQEGFYDWRDPGEVISQQLDRLSIFIKNIEMATAAWMNVMEQPKVVQFADHDKPVVVTEGTKIDWSTYDPAPTGRGPYGRHSTPATEGADADREEGGE